CFNQSFIIASLQTSEHVYLEALNDTSLDVPFRSPSNNTSVSLSGTSNSPLELFTRVIDLPNWSKIELLELLEMRILQANPQGLHYFTDNILNKLVDFSLGLPGLCLDLVKETVKKAISNNLESLQEEIVFNLIDPSYSRASTILKAFLLRNKPNELKKFGDSIQHIVNQITKKTRKDLIRFLLISLGGYHIQTRQSLEVGVSIEEYFTVNDTTKAETLARSLSPRQLAVCLEKKPSTLTYHLNWFQETDMITLITPSTIPALRQTTFDKIVLPQSPFAQLFEIILTHSPV
ncbi:MAG: hypothetical protein ACXAC7_16305, partial [Candidatus Hodarchaeales archaeon]